MKKMINNPGEKFNKLTLLSILNDKNKHGSNYAEFLCDCGKKHIAILNEVRSGRIKTCGCARHKYNYNEDIFYNNDDISYYLLGVFMTDGCVSKNRLSLSSKDTDWLESIKNLICKDLSLIKASKVNDNYAIFILNKNITKWFIKNNCVERKSAILEFPPNIPEKYIPDFLRGVIDGDGSIQDPSSVTDKRRASRVCIYSASKRFMEQIADIYDKWNIKYNILECQKAGSKGEIRGNSFERKLSVYRITVQSQEAYKLAKILCKNTNIDSISLERKFIKYKNII